MPRSWCCFSIGESQCALQAASCSLCCRYVLDELQPPPDNLALLIPWRDSSTLSQPGLNELLEDAHAGCLTP
jgi:hypothetical protein